METDTESILGGLKRIKGRIDGLIVTEAEIEGVACDSVPICSALKEGGYNPLFETTTREKNRIELQITVYQGGRRGHQQPSCLHPRLPDHGRQPQ